MCYSCQLYWKFVCHETNVINGYCGVYLITDNVDVMFWIVCFLDIHTNSEKMFKNVERFDAYFDDVL